MHLDGHFDLFRAIIVNVVNWPFDTRNFHRYLRAQVYLRYLVKGRLCRWLALIGDINDPPPHIPHDFFQYFSKIAALAENFCGCIGFPEILQNIFLKPSHYGLFSIFDFLSDMF